MRFRANKRIALAAVLMLILLVTAACSGSRGEAAAEPVTADNYYLDTVCTISIYEIKDGDGNAVPASEAEEQAQEAIDAAWKRCAELDKLLSRTQEVSEISRINNAGGEWTEVSEETLELIKSGIAYSELSDGAFDITIGGVTDLWDFHADPEDAKLPDEAKLAEAVKHVGYEKIEIDGSKVRLTDPETRIDLGGIAKGYIGDRLTEVLEEKGVTSGIINLGGNVICIGAKDDGSSQQAGDDGDAESDNGDANDGAFSIGVEAPYSDRTEIVGKIKAADMTLVTSGVYERQIEVDGKVYHHILSTKTGYSVDSDLDAVTLTAAKGRSGDIDALSTICLIKGAKAAKELIENTDGVEAVFLLHDGSIDVTSGMDFEPAE